MVFLFWGFQFLEKREHRKYFMVLIAALMFHNSAIFGLAIFAVYWLVAKENTYNVTLKSLALILIGICSILGLDFFIAVINFFGLRYDNYISGDLQLMPNQFLYRLPILLLLLSRWRFLKRTNHLTAFFFVMIVYDILASQLISIFEQSGRIEIYFSEYYMLVYPSICMASSFKDNRKVIRFAVIAYLVIYWWYIYVFGGVGETVPYVSIFA